MSTEEKSFNIMDHKLVPFHEIISDDEREELFRKYKISPSDLPKILDTDPVAIFIGAKPGQIVKIIRKSHTAKEAVTYRLVVQSNK